MTAQPTAHFSAQRTAQNRIGPLVILLLGQFLADVLLGMLVSQFGAHFGLPLNLRAIVALSWLGAVFAQVSLIAVWNAYGRGPLFLRTAISLSTGTMIWLISFGSVLSPEMRGPKPALLAIAMLVQWLVFQVPLWGTRMFLRWRLRWEGQDESLQAASEAQFGIVHVLGWTTVVAGILGTGRLLLVREPWHVSETVGFGLFVVFNSLIGLPAIWSSLVTGRVALGCPSAFGFVIILTLVEPLVFALVLGGDRSRSGAFFILNGIQFFWVAGSASYLRWIGLRIGRAPRQVIPLGVE